MAPPSRHRRHLLLHACWQSPSPHGSTLCIPPHHALLPNRVPSRHNSNAYCCMLAGNIHRLLLRTVPHHVPLRTLPYRPPVPPSQAGGASGCVLMGDFNTAPGSGIYSFMAQGSLAFGSLPRDQLSGQIEGYGHQHFLRDAQRGKVPLAPYRSPYRSLPRRAASAPPQPAGTANGADQQDQQRMDQWQGPFAAAAYAPWQPGMPVQPGALPQGLPNAKAPHIHAGASPVAGPSTPSTPSLQELPGSRPPGSHPVAPVTPASSSSMWPPSGCTPVTPATPGRTPFTAAPGSGAGAAAAGKLPLWTLKWDFEALLAAL
eukprot:111831-Chlamydomonas_euryale.AAC.1